MSNQKNTVSSSSWSASPYGSYNGRLMNFSSGDWGWYGGSRAYGFPVRAVAEE